MELIAELVDVFSTDEADYTVRLHGRALPRGRWEGFLEFAMADGSNRSFWTTRETSQPTKADLIAWSTTLKPVFLEGALARARKREIPTDESGIHPKVPLGAAGPSGPVLDPFDVHAKEGEVFLQKRLDALSPDHLSAIIRAFDLASPTVDLATLDHGTMATIIVSAVRAAAAARNARG